MSLFTLRGRTEGIGYFGRDLEEEVLRSAERQVGEAAAVLGKEMRRLVSKRGGPAPPGSPPTRDEDWLWKSIGWTRAKRRGNVVESKVGVGFGRGYKALQEAKAAGVNPFDYAWTMEYGGMSGKTGTTRLAPRSFVRPAEVKVESEVIRILTIH